MKKTLATLVALIAISASAYDVTNTVTIVSNIYNRISEEHWITNNIKNTHTNYHYTNNVYTVSNVTLLVSQTNIHTTATYDMGRSMLSIMSNDVNSAKASIRSTADEAAGSASRASSSASSASSSAASAQNTLNNVNTNGAEIINRMNAKQNWFDQNYGKMITNLNVTVTTNIYHNEDTVAREGVAQNAADIAELCSKIDGVKAEGSNLIEYSNAKKYCVLLTLTVQGIQMNSALGTFSAGSRYVHQGSEYVYSLYGVTNLNFGVNVSSLVVLDMGANKYPTVHFRNSYGESASVVFPASDSMMLPTGQSDSSSIFVDHYGTKTQGSIRVVYAGIATDKFDGTVNRYISADLGIYNSLFGTKEDRLAKISDVVSSTNGIASKIGKIEWLYNDGSGYDIGYVYDVYYMNERIGKLKILVENGYVYVRSRYEYEFEFEPMESTSYRDASITYVYKTSSGYMGVIGAAKRKSTGASVSFTISGETADHSITYFPTGRLPLSGNSYVNRQLAESYTVNSDFTVRKGSSVIDRLVLMTQLSALSNWVEQVFQKK